MKKWGLVAIMALLAGCGNVRHVEQLQPMEQGQSWVLLPMMNLAEAPLAAEKAEQLLETALRQKGIGQLKVYAANGSNGLPAFNERGRFEQAKKEARASGVRYGIGGSVTEWTYKVGLDGEPAVGLTLQVVDLKNDQIVWNASGSRSGWGRQAVSAIADDLIRDLVKSLEVK